MVNSPLKLFLTLPRFRLPGFLSPGSIYFICPPREGNINFYAFLEACFMNSDGSTLMPGPMLELR